MSSNSPTKNIVSCFEEIGLSEDHAMVFMASLSQGAVGASIIAKASGLPRSSTYDILDMLVEKGLISVVEGDAKKQFTANDPQALFDLVSERKQRLDNSVKTLGKELVDLRSHYISHQTASPNVRFYSGEHGLKTALYDCINTKELLVLCLGSDEGQSSLTDDPWYLRDFIEESARRSMKCREMLEDTPAAREYKTKYENSTDSIVLIPKNTSKDIEHVDKHIYDNKVAYISHDTLTAIIIEDASIAEHERAQFEILWIHHKTN